MFKKKLCSTLLSVVLVLVPLLTINCNVFAKENEEHPDAHFNISPDSYTISHSGYTDITCSFEPLQFGFINDDILATKLELEFPRTGMLSDENGNSVSFKINNSKHNLATGSRLYFSYEYNENEIYEPFTFSIEINRNDYRSLVPGTYTGRISYSATWKSTMNIYNGNHSDISCPDGSFELTLTITDPKSESGYFNDGFFWTLDSDGKLTVSGQGDMYNFTSFSTPWDSCKRDILSIDIQPGITSISDDAFAGCSNAIEISIPSGVTRIGDYAFSGCKFTNVVIPEGVFSIGDAAFHGCDKLKSIIIPVSAISIGKNAFAYCSKLNNVILSRSAYSAEAFPNSPMQVFRFYYEVNYTSDNNGVITGNSISFGGNKLEVKVTPNSNYAVDKITLDYAGKNVEITEDANGKYIYTMPDVDGSVTISATFKEKVNAYTILTQPTDFTGSAGDIATFNVAAEGQGLTFQWQRYKDGKWKNNSSTGAKTDTLYVEIYDSRDGFVYRCVITDANGNTLTTDEVTLHVSGPIVIVTQPEDYYGSAGDIATFSVEAEGKGLRYQWQRYKDGTWKNIASAGSKTDTLSVEIYDSRDGFVYRCVITDANGNTLTTDEITLHVSGPIVIVTQPEDYYGSAGDIATFSVEAEGKGLRYQWQRYKDGTWKSIASTGAKTDTLSVEIYNSRDGFVYRCVITDANGNILSTNDVTLHVK